MTPGETPPAPNPGEDLLWPGPATVRRGPKPRFTVAQIADAGTRIADAEGLGAVTMQRIAHDLGSTKMALYRYVPGRAELDAVMLDRSFGMPRPQHDADWRRALAAWAEGVHARALAHPWSVELAQRPHRPGPCELAWYEVGLAAMADLELHGGEKLDVLALLAGHAMSIVRQESASAAPEQELAASMQRIFTTRAADYPLTVAAFSDPGGARGDALRFGVERIVAGVEALAASRREG
ncbi:TetR/AcrR family transcriptional regulator C-terminal domain-containing protein [Microbacterium sp. NEAU-LLC]|uniref:TetR/AcrR family transcriptional regulator C-terminal domain-containing protein n=1 Tax=Microbacterium helvum TaxID=2773713 RepID=A0ABR8NS57_9MICO|nr:TetR/AcrR family transcriptional regulator C-terminal domain-containing protein [Microbacterium helvum]MBD3941876.1 TetR/AcrR family transcriptional regulator C-terminal domain-containing protein [Microbacterium helvum]